MILIFLRSTVQCVNLTQETVHKSGPNLKPIHKFNDTTIVIVNPGIKTNTPMNKTCLSYNKGSRNTSDSLCKGVIVFIII